MWWGLSAPAATSLERDSAEASERCTKYEWAKAAELYQRDLDRLGTIQDASKTGQLLEIIARCRYKEAFQSRTRAEFRQRMGLCESILKEATADYQNASLDSLANKSKANSIFARFWMTEDPTERRRLIQECATLSTQAAQSFENTNDT